MSERIWRSAYGGSRQIHRRKPMIITLGDALKELMQNIEKNYKKTLDFENKVNYNKGVLKNKKD